MILNLLNLKKKENLLIAPIATHIKSKNLSWRLMFLINRKTQKKIKREQDKIFASYNKQLDKLKSEVEKNFTYVGKKFPEEARKIHYGEKSDKPIYGEATEKESQDLIKEGISLVKLPFDVKDKKKN